MIRARHSNGPSGSVRRVSGDGPRTASDGVLGSPRVLVMLMALRMAMLLFVLLSPEGTGSTVDAYRFEEIGRSGAAPWREMPVEYPPVQLLVVELIAGDGGNATTDRLAILSFVGDIGTALVLAWGWGRRASMGYLLFAAPLLTVLYWRMDPFFVAIAVGSVAVARKRSPWLGGVGLAVATLARLWPAILIPAVGRRAVARTFVAFAAATAIGLAAWMTVGGTDAPRQVITFRDAQGWSADGLVGSIRWAGGEEVRTEQGSIRIGIVEPWHRAMLGVALLGSLVWIWSKGVQHRESAGVASVTAVAALLVFSPLSSVQFVVWLLPWAAIALMGERRDRAVAAWCAGASVAAGLWIFGDVAGQDGIVWPMQAAFLAKNVLILGAFLTGMFALARPSSADRPLSVAREGVRRRSAPTR
jgi:hypothetical protein